MFLLPILGFIFISLLVLPAALVFMPSASAVERRLGEIAAPRIKPVAEHAGYGRMVGAIKQLGSVAPKSTSEMGTLRRKLVNAGYRSSEALPIFFGIRAAVALGGFVLFASP